MDIKDLLGEKYHDGMTDDEIKAGLKDIFGGADDSDVTRLKGMLSDRNSEIAKLKKDLKSHLTDEEARKAAEQEDREKLEEENKSLKEQLTVSANKANLISLGYSDALAEATAKAMYAGDTTTVLANQKQFLAEHDKAVIAEQMRKTPTPGTGSGTPEGMTLKKLRDMSQADRVKYATEHPDEYKELYEKGD